MGARPSEIDATALGISSAIDEEPSMIEDDEGRRGDELRRWLALLRRPDQLARTGALELARAHGRLPTNASALDNGRATAAFLMEQIERLNGGADTPRAQQLPYLVLKTCFIDGHKLVRAAMQLGMSERQLSRERARAIELLRSELDLPETLTEVRYRPEQIPAIADYVARPALLRSLQQALALHPLTHVHGPPGGGKTCLVAELAAETARQTPVFWFRFRADVNDSLTALLFELGEHLREQGATRLATYMDEALPVVDLTLATRLALQALGSRPGLVVLDDFHVVADVAGIAGLIEEIVSRLPDIRLVTTSRHRDIEMSGAASFAVPTFTLAETGLLLTQLGTPASEGTVSVLHRWTGGIPHLIKLAAAWIKTTDETEVARSADRLDDLDEVQDFLLDYITELLDVDDRGILEAASVFRDRFTDDALAHVAGRTRGEVQDASRRLVRMYIATRGRDGDCSFFHTSVRDYVYDRLEPAWRSELHRRAAEWYDERRQDEKASAHRRQVVSPVLARE